MIKSISFDQKVQKVVEKINTDRYLLYHVSKDTRSGKKIVRRIVKNFAFLVQYKVSLFEFHGRCFTSHDLSVEIDNFHAQVYQQLMLLNAHRKRYRRYFQPRTAKQAMQKLESQETIFILLEWFEEHRITLIFDDENNEYRCLHLVEDILRQKRIIDGSSLFGIAGAPVA